MSWFWAETRGGSNFQSTWNIISKSKGPPYEKDSFLATFPHFFVWTTLSKKFICSDFSSFFICPPIKISGFNLLFNIFKMIPIIKILISMNFFINFHMVPPMYIIHFGALFQDYPLGIQKVYFEQLSSFFISYSNLYFHEFDARHKMTIFDSMHKWRNISLRLKTLEISIYKKAKLLLVAKNVVLVKPFRYGFQK